MKMIVRNATEHDLEIIMTIQDEMYGPEFKRLRPTFSSLIKTFPEGTFICLTFRGQKEQIEGFALTERVGDCMPIPNIHDPIDFYSPSGKVIYVSGFGVRKLSQQRENVGHMIYSAVIRLADAISASKIFVLCSSSGDCDAFERLILKHLKFKLYSSFDWEILPGKVVKHDAWIKIVNRHK